MLRLRRPSGLCSRTLSDPANRLLKRTDSEGSSSAAEKKSSAVPLFAAVTYRQSAPDYPRERGDPQEGGNRRCLPSCAPARRQRRLSTLLCARAASAQMSTLLCARAASAQFRSLLKRHSPVRERSENHRLETVGVYPLARRRGCGEPPRQRLALILYAQEAAKPQFTSCTDRNRVLK